ncbi:hypothetical protein AAFG13_17645 [Bradyrhizobium sp. B124]|uniref:hypothetical protein n=1 Tax=Bradyrhizobium sp. B124 TaxID=3140245 RepID=UPI003182ED50
MFQYCPALVLNADLQSLSYFPLSLFNREDAVEPVVKGSSGFTLGTEPFGVGRPRAMYGSTQNFASSKLLTVGLSREPAWTSRWHLAQSSTHFFNSSSGLSSRPTRSSNPPSMNDRFYWRDGRAARHLTVDEA